MYFTTSLLQLRRSRPHLFDGEYIAIETEENGHWIAFQRRHEGESLLVVVPRRSGSWDERPNARIPLTEDRQERTWHDVLTGSTIRCDTELETGALDLHWGVLTSEGS